MIKKEKFKDKTSLMPQKTLNNVYEEPEFDIARRYAVLLNTMFSTAFYSAIIPNCQIYAMIYLCFHYIGDKYILLRRKTVKSNMSTELSIEMTE